MRYRSSGEQPQFAHTGNRSVWAVLATALALGSAMGAWAGCPIGVVPEKHAGGGACKCTGYVISYPIYDENGGVITIVQMCTGSVTCENGLQDYKATNGYCDSLLPYHPNQCETASATWTVNYYSDAACGWSSSAGATGSCTVQSSSQASSVYGYNNQTPCDELI